MIVTTKMSNKEILALSFRCAIEGKVDDAEHLLSQLPQHLLEVRYNRGWFDMYRGKLREGFEGLNSGRFIDVFGSPAIPGSIWHDDPLDGKTLLLRMEGGLGDEIINFRFAKEFKALGANVVISCSASLARLFSEHGFVCISEEAIPKTYYDYWVPAMSAPYVLNHSYDTLPGAPYLKRPATPKGDRIRIGVRWGGNVNNKDVEPHRKVDAKRLIAISETIDADFFSFQRDNDLLDVPFTDLRDELTDWQATAHLLSTMDVLVTSCTSIAHLAAAMGVTTWILVPLLPYYTWAVPGPRSAWHETVTLYRQTTPGNWDDPIAEIQRDLALLTKQKKAA